MSIIFTCAAAILCIVMGWWRLNISDLPATAACYFVMASICVQMLFREIDESKGNK